MHRDTAATSAPAQVPTQVPAQVPTSAAPTALTPRQALAHAIELAARGPLHGPNPRVGCVILAPNSGQGEHTPRRVLAVGWHRGAGTPHAEADALSEARERGIDVSGASAYVSLEPCNHTGRTGPCSHALLAAQIGEVTYAVADPNGEAAGGGEFLREAGVNVVGPVEAERSEDDARPGHELLRVWLHAVRAGRPFVTLKTAATLDGRIAAKDGSSQWITSPASREHAHGLRAEVDAIAVGTSTALIDDPTLTARTTDGLAAHQPLRVVIGSTPVPDAARLRTTPGGEFVQIASHDVAEVLAELARRGVRHLLVEGGPTVAAAFLRAGVVDEIQSYVAPVLLGAGRSAVDDLGIDSIGAARRFATRRVAQLGPDVVIIATPIPDPAPVPSTATFTSAASSTKDN